MSSAERTSSSRACFAEPASSTGLRRQSRQCQKAAPQKPRSVPPPPLTFGVERAGGDEVTQTYVPPSEVSPSHVVADEAGDEAITVTNVEAMLQGAAASSDRHAAKPFFPVGPPALPAEEGTRVDVAATLAVVSATWPAALRPLPQVAANDGQGCEPDPDDVTRPDHTAAIRAALQGDARTTQTRATGARGARGTATAALEQHQLEASIVVAESLRASSPVCEVQTAKCAVPTMQQQVTEACGPVAAGRRRMVDVLERFTPTLLTLAPKATPGAFERLTFVLVIPFLVATAAGASMHGGGPRRESERSRTQGQASTVGSFEVPVEAGGDRVEASEGDRQNKPRIQHSRYVSF